MHNFHEDPCLADLLPDKRREQLLQLLQQLQGTAITLYETPVPNAEPVEFNLETLAWLQGGRDIETQAAAARLLEFVLHFVGKYRLAANLHRDTTEASFIELQRQNAVLRESEERYRELSEQLQERVDAQVRVIEQTQRQLYDSARLRAVGQLAGGVAHEINNPVGFITSNLRVAGRYLDEIEATLPSDESTAFVLQDFRALLEESLSGARRISAIVADLKTFSNVDRADFTPCGLNALLSAACNLLQAEHGQRLVVELTLGDLPPIRGYPAMLSQAFYNVLDNAAKAIVDSGVIRVSSQSVGGGMLEVCIEDNGGGIPEAILPRLFDPFFSTRGVGGGTGLGLTVSRDVMRAHCGEISINSQEGKGTSVIMRFPEYQARPHE